MSQGLSTLDFKDLMGEAEEEASLKLVSTREEEAEKARKKAEPYFNKIRINGMIADLDGFAYRIEQVNNQRRISYFYLSIIGHKGIVDALWASMIKAPPEQATIYAVDEDDNDLTGLRPVWGWLPPKERVNGFSYPKMNLVRSNAYQRMIIPNIAFLSNINVEKVTERNKKEKEKGKAKAEAPKEFLLLGEADAKVDFKDQYFRRLNKLSSLPMKRDWADWLWDEAMGNGEISLLPSHGVEAYLCTQPDDSLLAEAMTMAIQANDIT